MIDQCSGKKEFCRVVVAELPYPYSPELSVGPNMRKSLDVEKVLGIGYANGNGGSYDTKH